MKTEIKNYESPSIDIVDVEIEKGFAASEDIVEGSGIIDAWQQGDTSDWITE